MRRVVLALVTSCVLGGSAVGQDKTDKAQKPVEPLPKVVEKWLATDHQSEELMADTVKAVLEKPGKGLAYLGSLLPAAAEKPNAPRSKGLRSLCTQVTLEHLRRTWHSGMTFVGQYGELNAMQPFATDFIFEMLLETPDWYPLTFRVRLVPALRDVQLKSPSVARLDGIIKIVEDEQETIGLRNALAGALWQWGKPKYARKVLQGLLAETAVGDGEDRVNATLNLADYYNVLRDYKGASRAHRTAQALAKHAKVDLPPIAFYSAACVQALQGDVENGIKSLETCARMHASPDLDNSLRLERSLWEKDPEIAALRADKRFAALLVMAFGEKKKDTDGKRSDGKDTDGEGGR